MIDQAAPSPARPKPPHESTLDVALRTCERHPRLVQRAAVAGLLLTFLLSAICILFLLPTTRKTAVQAAASAPEPQHSAQLTTLRRRAEALQQQLNALPAASPQEAAVETADSAREQRLYGLQDDIVQAEAAFARASTGSAELPETRQDSSASPGQSQQDASALLHRESLLRTSYDVALLALPPDARTRAQAAFLRKQLRTNEEQTQALLQQAGLQQQAGRTAANPAPSVLESLTSLTSVRSLVVLATVPLLGLLIGLLAGLALASARERKATVFRSPGEIRRGLHLRELGIIPAIGKLHANLAGAASNGFVSHLTAVALSRWDDDFSITAEAYRQAAETLLKQPADHVHSYVVLSSREGEGKTAAAANLGVALGRLRRRVVLIDGVLDRPALHRAFSIENYFGLANVLRGEVDLETIPTQILATETFHPGVSVIPVGQLDSSQASDSASMLRSPHLQTLLNRLSRSFDVILIDAPALLSEKPERAAGEAGQPESVSANATQLAALTGNAILVVCAGSTERSALERAAAELRARDIAVAGTILNGFDPTLTGNQRFYRGYVRYQLQLAQVPSPQA